MFASALMWHNHQCRTLALMLQRAGWRLHGTSRTTFVGWATHQLKGCAGYKLICDFTEAIKPGCRFLSQTETSLKRPEFPSSQLPILDRLLTSLSADSPADTCWGDGAALLPGPMSFRLARPRRNNRAALRNVNWSFHNRRCLITPKHLHLSTSHEWNGSICSKKIELCLW